VGEGMVTKEMLKKIKEYQEKENKLQNAMDSFSKVFAPSSYEPVLELGITQAYIAGIARNNKQVIDLLEYFTYEAPNLKGTIAQVTANGKTYNFKNEKSVIKFFKENYPLTSHQSLNK
jgi:hypothetical protein